MAVSMPFVSVIVPVFRGMRDLPDCLAALERQDYLADGFEVVVVDNGDNPGIEDCVAACGHAVLVRESHPSSYAARNRGIDVARGEILAFTDADCVPAPGWLAAGVAALDDDRIGLAGGRIDVHVRDRARPSAAELYERTTMFLQERNVQRGHFAQTANAFVRREVIRAIGPFAAAITSGGDTEFGQRVHAAGFGLAYVDAASVVHVSHRGVADLLQRRRRVAGGHHQRMRSGSDRDWPRTLYRGTFRFLRLLSDRPASAPSDLPSLGRVLAVELLLAGGYAAERARLMLGGRPRRA